MDRQIVDVATAGGPARLTLCQPSGVPRGTLVLGHGAGGGIEAPDLVAVTSAAVGGGWRVGLVEQPWRVAGRRVASPPPRLDEAWLALLAVLGASPGAGPSVTGAGPSVTGAGPLVTGGRSAGARVACRTAAAVRADAVLCLAFPLHPPGRPDRSRADELALATRGGRPVCVVQGARDAFGTPQDVVAVAGSQVVVVPVPGDHALRADVGAVARAVVEWLDGLTG